VGHGGWAFLLPGAGNCFFIINLKDKLTFYELAGHNALIETKQ
jgi:hypothetical protein